MTGKVLLEVFLVIKLFSNPSTLITTQLPTIGSRLEGASLLKATEIVSLPLPSPLNPCSIVILLTQPQPQEFTGWFVHAAKTNTLF
jgi:hypothetical protein